MNYLSSFVDKSDDKYASKFKTLPLVHTTDAYYLRDIIKNGSVLQPVHDEVFNEDLTYLFYGKPAYTKNRDSYSSFSTYLPITFIIDPTVKMDIKRIFPFDSGGYGKDVFKNYIPDKLRLEDFELKPLDNFPDNIKKLQAIFYGDNEHYYKNQPRKDLLYDNFHFEVQTFSNLITSIESSAFDERFSTIEIQINSQIHLEKSLLGIIVPAMMMSSDIFKGASSTWKNAKIFYYNDFRSKPDYYSALIVEKVGDFLLSGGYFDEQ